MGFVIFCIWGEGMGSQFIAVMALLFPILFTGSAWSLSLNVFENPLVEATASILQDTQPLFPNQRSGLLHRENTRTSLYSWTGDYIMPVRITRRIVLFGEFHAEANEVCFKFGGNSTYYQKYAGGAGIRYIVNNETFLGLNFFRDTQEEVRGISAALSSYGWGAEFVTITPGNGAAELIFNNHANLLVEPKYQPNVQTLEIAYNNPLLDNRLDVRLKAVGYQYFQSADRSREFRIGVDITTGNGLFTLRYDYGQTVTNVKEPFNVIAGYVNVGLKLENILYLKNPFTYPEPIFNGIARNMRRLLTRPVERDLE
jgi:hypothetical protein